jgi:tetratricopeptide (TPR) repeat protein
MVNKGDGNLKNIFESITEKGKITDDFSLIRISFKENIPPVVSLDSEELNNIFENIKLIQKESPDRAIELLKNAAGVYKKNAVIIKKLVKFLVDKKDYKSAVPYLDQYNEINPIDTEMIYIYSYSLMKIGNYIKSAEFAERIVLRNPENIKYLLHLAKIYITLNNYFEADKLLDKVILLSPENEKALAMKNSM